MRCDLHAASARQRCMTRGMVPGSWLGSGSEAAVSWPLLLPDWNTLDVVCRDASNRGAYQRSGYWRGNVASDSTISK
jgi:hypothetical protein